MEKSDLDYFIAGLKSVIKSKFASQEKFADGVTSKVNLSNVLRGERGASFEMRKKLATRAGLTVEEVIALGKGKLRPEADISKDTTELGSPGISFSAYELSDMSSSELLSKVDDYSSGIARHAKALAVERNRLLRLFRKEKAVNNSINEAIKVVNKNYKITYCNRTYTEKYQQVEGDFTSKENCISCQGACLAGKVFATGKPEHSLVDEDGSWVYKTAYPILTLSGTIDGVAVVSREIDPLLELMREMGWECNPKGKA